MKLLIFISNQLVSIYVIKYFLNFHFLLLKFRSIGLHHLLTLLKQHSYFASPLMLRCWLFLLLTLMTLCSIRHRPFQGWSLPANAHCRLHCMHGPSPQVPFCIIGFPSLLLIPAFNFYFIQSQTAYTSAVAHLPLSPSHSNHSVYYLCIPLFTTDYSSSFSTECYGYCLRQILRFLRLTELVLSGRDSVSYGRRSRLIALPLQITICLVDPSY